MELLDCVRGVCNIHTSELSGDNDFYGQMSHMDTHLYAIT